MTTHAYRIAEVQQVKEFEAFFSHYILLYIDLDTVAAALKMGETGLAHQSNGDEASRNTNVATIGLQFA